MIHARIDPSSVKMGDTITVLVGGEPYTTVIDSEGVQRFVGNPIVTKIVLSGQELTARGLDAGVYTLPRIFEDYLQGKYTIKELRDLYLLFNYPVRELADLNIFEGVEFENPLW